MAKMSEREYFSTKILRSANNDTGKFNMQSVMFFSVQFWVAMFFQTTELNLTFWSIPILLDWLNGKYEENSVIINNMAAYALLFMVAYN